MTGSITAALRKEENIRDLRHIQNKSVNRKKICIIVVWFV
jgi:hypothetical protein